MHVLIIDNGTSFLNNLKKLFKSEDVTILPFNHVTRKDTSRFDLIVLSGGHKYSVVNHEKEYKNELDIIRNARKPILGICLGFELIAYGYGCELKRLKKKEKGTVRIRLLPDKTTLGLKEISVYESHRWVVKDTGKELVALGLSADGVEMFKHKSKPIYGLQFHPEIIRSGLKGKALFSNILSVISSS